MLQPGSLEQRSGTLPVGTIRSPDTVYIFGAGHVGQALAALTGRVGFRTVVLDDRKSLPTGKDWLRR
jgi:threonine dehydrogenase-like Zn-dependent dehydrogenase